MISKRTALGALAAIAATGPAHAAVTISTATTQNMTCSGGVCAPTANDAVLNVSDLQSLLGSGNLEVTTTGSGVQAKDIQIGATLTWASANTLSLAAKDSIAIRAPVSVSGAGALSLLTGNNGTLSFGKKGSVSFSNLSSRLAIQRKPYTLVGSISALASAVKAKPGGNYALANNYDASQNGVYSDSPIATALTGTVQGLGNTISNLTVVHEGKGLDIGLFVGIESTGSVANLRLHKLSITVSGDKNAAVGGLAATSAGLLTGDEVQGVLNSKVGGSGGAGGLVADNGGTITHSTANVRVRGSGDSGGLAGENQGSISLSSAEGSVRSFVAGGLVGFDLGTIDQSFATGDVAGGNPGGLVGSGGKMITNSYSTGSVGGATQFDGGLVSDGQAASITSSYSTGAITTGGGFVCETPQATFSNDYWDTDTSGTTNGTCDGNVSGITGRTTAQLQSGLPTGFDPAIWAEDSNINGGFPYLINNPPPK